MRNGASGFAQKEELTILRQEQARSATATAEALRGGVASSLDALPKLAPMMALPAPAQRSCDSDENLTAGQTVFLIPGGYAPGPIIVFCNMFLLSETECTVVDGSHIVLANPVSADELIGVRTSLGGCVINANLVFHLHSIGSITCITSAWLHGIFINWFNDLPFYSGDGSAPVSAGKPFNNNGCVEIAQ